MLAMFNLGGGEIEILLIGLPILAFWIWTLVDAIQNKGLSDGERVAWIVAILFGQIVGSVIYYYVGHPKRLRSGPGT